MNMNRRFVPVLLASTVALGVTAAAADAKPTQAQRDAVKACMAEKGYVKGEGERSAARRAARKECRTQAGITTKAKKGKRGKKAAKPTQAQRDAVKACMAEKGYVKGEGERSAARRAARKECRTQAGIATKAGSGKSKKAGKGKKARKGGKRGASARRGSRA